MKCVKSLREVRRRVVLCVASRALYSLWYPHLFTHRAIRPSERVGSRMVVCPVCECVRSVATIILSGRCWNIVTYRPPSSCASPGCLERLHATLSKIVHRFRGIAVSAAGRDKAVLCIVYVISLTCRLCRFSSVNWKRNLSTASQTDRAFRLRSGESLHWHIYWPI